MYDEDPETTNWRQLHKKKKMKKVLYTVVALTGAMLVAPAAFAQTTAAPVGGTNWVAISAAFDKALAAFGGALAQSRVASSACEGMARNPGASGAIRAAMILGLVFIETLLLFTLLIVFVKI